LLLTVHLFW